MLVNGQLMLLKMRMSTSIDTMLMRMKAMWCAFIKEKIGIAMMDPAKIAHMNVWAILMARKAL